MEGKGFIVKDPGRRSPERRVAGDGGVVVRPIEWRSKDACMSRAPDDGMVGARAQCGWRGSALVAEDKPGADAPGSRRDSATGGRLRGGLGTCAAEDYARLFEPDGAFASGPRGTVTRTRPPHGARRERAALQRRLASGRADPAPTMEIEATPGRRRRQGSVGPDGSYVDDTT